MANSATAHVEGQFNAGQTLRFTGKIVAAAGFSASVSESGELILDGDFTIDTAQPLEFDFVENVPAPTAVTPVIVTPDNTPTPPAEDTPTA